MTARDLARAFSGLAAAALVGWLSGSVAWGVVTALAAFIAWHAIQFRGFARWSRRPLGRPHTSDAAWGALADRLHRAVGLSRSRSRALVATLRRLRTTTDTIPDGWVILRTGGEIEDYNRGARDRLGLSANDHGQNLVALVRDPGIVSLLRGEVESDIVEIAAPADETRRIELRRIDIDEERALVMARDVTELNRLLTMRQDFVANVSHELRTPLTVIVGYLEELDEDNPDFETLRDVLPKLTPPARRMRALVDDLLTLTRLESAPLPSDETTEDIDVGLMLNTIVAEARQLSAGVHRIVLHAESDLHLRGVSTELYSAFNNLVTNAVRYSPDGGTIDVRWYQSAARSAFRGGGPRHGHCARTPDAHHGALLPHRPRWGARSRGHGPRTRHREARVAPAPFRPPGRKRTGQGQSLLLRLRPGPRRRGRRAPVRDGLARRRRADRHGRRKPNALRRSMTPRTPGPIAAAAVLGNRRRGLRPCNPGGGSGGGARGRPITGLSTRQRYLRQPVEHRVGHAGQPHDALERGLPAALPERQHPGPGRGVVHGRRRPSPRARPTSVP